MKSFAGRRLRVGRNPALLAIAAIATGCLTFAGDQLEEVPVEPATTRRYQAGLAEAHNQDVEDAFRAGGFPPTRLGARDETEGFVFFDLPDVELSGFSGAMLEVRDSRTREPRTLHLGDPSPCAGDTGPGP